MSANFDAILPFMKVRVFDIPRDVISSIKRKIDLKWDVYPQYFVRKPTMREHTLFVTMVNDPSRMENSNFVNVEAMAIAKRVAPVWNGTVITVDGASFECSPVIHPVEQKIAEGDLITVATAVIMLKVNKQKEVESTINTSVVREGPLSVLMTPLSLAQYSLTMGNFLESHKVESKQAEPFAMAVTAAILKATPDERKELREATFGLFSRAKISTDQKSRTVYKDPNYDYDIKGVQKSTKGRLVPVMLPKALKCIVPTIPQTLTQGKETCNEMLKQIQSRFPTRLGKYYSYRGFPDDNQRLFMEIRPFVTVYPVCDPPEMLKKWMIANGLGAQARISGDLWVESTVMKSEVPIVFRKYDEKMVAKDAIFFGSVVFSDAFWAGYKVLVYRPPVNGIFCYTPKDTDVSALAPEYCGWKLQVCATSIQLSTLLSAHTATLATMVFKGTFASRGAQYAGLKYPLEVKEYLTVTPTEMTEEDRQEAKNVGRTTVQGKQVEVLVEEEDVPQEIINAEEPEVWEQLPVVKKANPMRYARGRLPNDMSFQDNDSAGYGETVTCEDLPLFMFTQDVPTVTEDGEVKFTYVLHEYQGMERKWLLVGTANSCYVAILPDDTIEYINRYMEAFMSVKGHIAPELGDD